jgi:hypothetical protein
LAFTATAGTGAITCNQTGYTGNANYTCQASGVASITKTCDCASGYAKNASDVCVLPSCPVSLVGISNTSVTSGTGNLTCGNGYAGTVGYSCGCSSENVYNIKTNGSYSSYYSCPTFTLGTIPVSGILKQVSISFYAADQNSGNYCSYTNVNIKDSNSNSLYYKGYNTPRPGNTLTTNEVVNTNVSAGNPIYFNVCSEYPGCSNSINTFNLSVKIQTGSSSCSSPTLTTSGTCAQIQCTVAYANTTTNGAPVNFTTTATPLNCIAGFTGSPTYTCTGTTNPGSFAQAGTTCTPITCTAPASNGYLAQSGLAFTATAGTGAITCNQTGYTGNANYTCQASGVASITSTCNCATGYTKNANGACVASSNSFTPNWYDSASAPAGVYVTTSSINSIGMAGPNNAGAGSWGYYLANLPTWVTKVSFNWTYYANDYGDFDRGYFFINGGWQYLANNNCTGCSSSGTITNWAITNMSDRRFGPGVWTQDGCCGAGFLTLSNIVFQ